MKTIIIPILFFVYLFVIVKSNYNTFILEEEVPKILNRGKENSLLRNQSAECECENGHCKRDSSGKIVCECLPEYGVYTEKKCKACDCGKNANCTFEKGKFWDEKYCLCPNGEKLRNMRCKDPCAKKPCKNGGTCQTHDGLTVDCVCTHLYSGHFCEKEIELEYTTDYSSSSVWPESTYNSGSEPQFTTEHSASTGWSESTRITAKVCDCGKYSIACSLDNEGNKICVCEAGFSQLFDTCIDCYCGENSRGCSFDKNNEKKCFCNHGYAQNYEACKETCKYDRECLNGGICKINYDGVGFCECRADYRGDRCEINGICNHFNDICQRYDAVCVVKSGLPSCECPSDKKDATGLCESICNPTKCINGRCEIFGQDYKCRCEVGFEGKYCDTKIIDSKRDQIIFVLFMTCMIFILMIIIGVLCMANYIRLKKKAEDCENFIKEIGTECNSVKRLQ